VLFRLRLLFILSWLCLSVACGPMQGQPLGMESGLDGEDIINPVIPIDEDQDSGDINSTPILKFIPMDWDGEHPDAESWSHMTYDGLNDFGDNLLNVIPSDIANFCPNYEQLNIVDRKMFWIHLISSMTRLESNFNPQASFQEAFNDAKGRPVISRGLLQLSIESALAYGCDLRDALQLHDPRSNLICTIKILNRWVGQDGVISRQARGRWLGGARYWSVLRRFSNRNPVSQIQARTRTAEVCH
jgi:hypothetical protein